MRKLAACIAAALLIAFAGAAFGEETINGRPLSEDHDIIRDLGGDITLLPKAQIMKITQGGSELRGSLWIPPYDRGRSKAPAEKRDVMKLSGLHDRDHYMGIVAAAGTKLIGGSKRRIVIGDFNFADGGGGIKTFLAEPTDDGSFKISGNVRDLSIRISGWASKNVFTDIRGGLFIDGEAHESFVAGFMNDMDRKNTFSDGDNGGDEARVGFMILDGRKLNDESFKENPAGYVVHDDYADSTDAQFPVLRIVAGDFDGDGIASEIACISTPKEEYYNVHIYKVKRSSDGTADVERIHTAEVGNIDLGTFHGSQRDTEPGCDIVAGDFDGDGRTEIAAVMVSKWGGESELKPYVEVFKYVGGSFKSSYQQDFVNDDFSSHFRDLSYTKIQGMLAVAGDFDGNGRDEVAFVTISDRDNTYVATVAFDPVDNEPPSPVLKGVYSTEHGSKGKDRTPLASVIALAAGPTYAAAGNDSMFDDIYVRISPVDGDPALYRVSNPLDRDHMGLTKIAGDGDGTKAALIISDLAGESMILGKPDHIIAKETHSYFTILPAVPYHIDYIRSNWKNKYDPPAPRTLQFITPVMSTVTYSKSESESEVKDTSFETHTHVDWGVGLNADLKFPVKEVGFKGGIEGGYKGSWDGIEKKLSSETTSRSTRIDEGAQDDDIVCGYHGTLHAWRYPILGSLAETESLIRDMFGDENDGAEVSKNDPLKNAPIDPKAQKFYTVFHYEDVGDSYPDAPFDDLYQPDHDERNLFSYPNALKFSKSYLTRQEDLSYESKFSSGTSVVHGIQFESIASRKDNEVETWNHGGSVKISGGIAIPKGDETVFSAGGYISGGINHTVSNGTTFTSTSKSSTSYSVNVNPDHNSNFEGFMIYTQAYVDAGGITTLGIAIDLRPSSNVANAWTDDGPYGTSPDPSLVLPYRVSAGSGREYGSSVRTPMAQTSLYTATQMRGVRYYDRTVGEDPDVGTSYTVSSLVKGRTYTIAVPIYNASFVDTDPFTVRLGYTTHDHLRSLEATKRAPASDDKDIRFITETTTKLNGWTKDSDAHRGVVSFDWTVPADVPGGAYEFCVRILGSDGDIHRDWNLVDETSSEYDPCGNDWGHFQFSVIEEDDLFDEEEKNPEYYDPADYDPTYTASAGTGDISAEAPTRAPVSEPKVEITFKVDDHDPMTFGEFRSWLLGRTDPVDVTIEVTNTGDRLIRDAFAVVYEQLEGGTRRTLLNGNLTSLFPGKSVSRRFTIDPQKFLSRDLRAMIIGSNILRTYGEPADGDPTDDDPTDDDPSTRGRSSGGCSTGAAGIVAIALLAAATYRKSKK